MDPLQSSPGPATRPVGAGFPFLGTVFYFLLGAAGGLAGGLVYSWWYFGMGDLLPSGGREFLFVSMAVGTFPGFLAGVGLGGLAREFSWKRVWKVLVPPVSSLVTAALCGSIAMIWCLGMSGCY